MVQLLPEPDDVGCANAGAAASASVDADIAKKDDFMVLRFKGLR
jgi:hypothetical protein